MEMISLFLIGLEKDCLGEYLMGPAKVSDNYITLSQGFVYTTLGVPPCSIVLWALQQREESVSFFSGSQVLSFKGRPKPRKKPRPHLVLAKKRQLGGCLFFPGYSCVKGPNARGRFPD